ncbi:amino acid permease [Cryobacterium sp. TMT2-10]|uniref:Amino acid permease n=1 Tax=Cryobacterium shii TaxID=1259235 RepID=A0AAQ2C994_9MICO|nr:MULTISPECIES: amino acid permease [Cryobacterium]TFC52554.1 amino acid permease [Cryobacterium shii]TFD18279.1 amino acid permease [Cryobacterium sp. TMT2-23]TFD42830.1 amino acid permease [Cryobacterium sp. TMT2-10]
MTTESTAVPAASAEVATSQGQLRRVLGVPSLVLFGLVYMVPLTVFTTYGIVTQMTGGRLPLAYLITLVAMVFTARSYGQMARAFPLAGSAYTYTQRSFGPAVGFLTGWSLMLDYLFLPMINYVVIGIYLNAAVPSVPAWTFVLASIALVTILNIVGIASVARANVVVIAVQAIFIVAFVGVAAATIGRGTSVDLLAPFVGNGTAPGFGPLAAGAAVLCLSFLGFDSVSTLAEETRDPKKSLPRAIMIITLIAGVTFIGLAYVSHLILPSHAFTSVDSAALDVVAQAGGAFLSTLFLAAYIAGAAGSALTSQASVARILFAMGRDGVLPSRIFGRLSARFDTPVLSILTVSIVSLLAVVIDLGLLAEMISFGALIAFSAVNLSVIKHHFFGLRKRGGLQTLNYLFVPAIGVVLTFWLWTSLSPRALVVGLVWLAVGFVYLLVLTRGFRRPTPMLDLKE